MTPSSAIADAFSAVLRDRADETVLMAPGERCGLTPRDIDGIAADLARGLRDAGLAAGHLVVASVGNLAATPSLVLACLRDALPVMPVDRSTPVAELVALADQWEAAALVVPEHVDAGARGAGTTPGRIGSGRRRVVLGHGLAAYVLAPLPAPGRHAPAAVLKLTSGSTGAPRAACTEERHLIADVRQIAAAMDIGPAHRQLGVIPLSHSYGFSNLLLPLLWQGTPLLLRPQFVPTQIATDIESGRLETFAGVPFMFEHLARHRPAPLPRSLRLVLSAGARLPYDTVEAFYRVTALKIRSFYGSSETGGICFDDSSSLDPRVPVGRPMGDTVVTLLDDADAPAGSGRVQVQGPNVLDRYVDAPVRTDAETSRPSGTAIAERVRAGFAGPGVFVTGDYAAVDANGAYVLTGRATSFVNVAGRKVHPAEVEAALRALPGVTDAIAMAVDDPVRGQALGACLVSDRAWDARTVREALSSRLAPYKLPRVVVVLPALPLTDRGKIDRVAIIRHLGGR